MSCQNQAKSCHAIKKSFKTSSSSGPCKRIRTSFSAKPCKDKLFSQAVTAHTAWENRNRDSPQPSAHRWVGENAARPMASWARQQQQITEAADGGARACTGADGAVALNLRRGPGAYALFSPGRAIIRKGPNNYILPGVQHGLQLLFIGVQPHAGQVRPERHVQLRDPAFAHCRRTSGGASRMRRAWPLSFRLQQLQEDLVRQAGQALAPVLLPAPRTTSAALSPRQLLDPGAPARSTVPGC